MRNFLFISLTLLFIPLAHAGENWPEFRGTPGSGHSDATGIALSWSETQNVTWKTAVHGRGWSSPVVWGDQIWVTTATLDGKTMSAICLDKTSGKITHDIKMWDIAEPQFITKMNTYASCTPAIEEGRVYIHFGSYGTACLDTKTGQRLWERRDLPCDHFRGPASSPIIYGKLLIMNFDGADYQYMVALDKTTGETIWKTDRDIKKWAGNGDHCKAYSTPVVIDVDGKAQLISPCATAAISYDPATGKELWRVRCGGMNVCARPVYSNGLVVFNTAAGGDKLLAVRPTGRGDVTKTHVAWRYRKSMPTRPSQLIVGDLLYVVSDAGVITCLELKTGEAVWQERLGGKYSASPLYVDGRIYFFSEEGVTTVIKPGRKYAPLASNQLDGRFMASPAVTGKALILRTAEYVYRVEK